MAIYRIKRFSSRVSFKKPDIKIRSHSSSHFKSYDSENPENNYELNYKRDQEDQKNPKEELSGYYVDPETLETEEIDSKTED